MSTELQFYEYVELGGGGILWFENFLLVNSSFRNDRNDTYIRTGPEHIKKIV